METKLYHPIVHQCRGHRLYYLLIKSLNGVDGGQDDLARVLKQSDLYGSAFVYVVFGESDFLVRVWADEDDVSDLYDRVFKSRNLEVSDCLICSRTLTWYQLEIEASDDWHQGLASPDRSDVEARTKEILNGSVPAPLSKRAGARKDRQQKIRFYIFAKEAELSGGQLYNELENEIRIGQTTFDDLDRVSLYSAYSILNNDRSLVLKCEADDFATGAATVNGLVERLSKEGQHHTTTYIVCATINESESLGSTASRSHHYDRYTQNLAATHDTSRILNASRSRESLKALNSRKDAFGKVFSRRRSYAALFWYDKIQWTRTMTRLRLMYQWVCKRGNDELKSCIINDYVHYEWQLRGLVATLQNSKVLQGFERKDDRSTNEMALRELSIACCTMLSTRVVKARLTLAEQKIAKQFKTLSVEWAVDRNLLAHGLVRNVFQTGDELLEKGGEDLKPEHIKRIEDADGRMLWEVLLGTYFELRCLFPWLSRVCSKVSSLNAAEVTGSGGG